MNLIFAGQYRREAPVFKIFAELAIPNVTVRPGIDEVQTYLSKAVQTIISISKTISQWDKERPKVSENPTRISSNPFLFLGKT